MLENFNEGKRKNSMIQFSDFHTGWSIHKKHNSYIRSIKKFTPCISRSRPANFLLQQQTINSLVTNQLQLLVKPQNRISAMKTLRPNH